MSKKYVLFRKDKGEEAQALASSFSLEALKDYQFFKACEYRFFRPRPRLYIKAVAEDYRPWVLDEKAF